MYLLWFCFEVFTVVFYLCIYCDFVLRYLVWFCIDVFSVVLY